MICTHQTAAARPTSSAQKPSTSAPAKVAPSIRPTLSAVERPGSEQAELDLSTFLAHAALAEAPAAFRGGRESAAPDAGERLAELGGLGHRHGEVGVDVDGDLHRAVCPPAYGALW